MTKSNVEQRPDFATSLSHPFPQVSPSPHRSPSLHDRMSSYYAFNNLAGHDLEGASREEPFDAKAFERVNSQDDLRDSSYATYGNASRYPKEEGANSTSRKPDGKLMLWWKASSKAQRVLFGVFIAGVMCVQSLPFLGTRRANPYISQIGLNSLLCASKSPRGWMGPGGIRSSFIFQRQISPILHFPRFVQFHSQCDSGV